MTRLYSGRLFAGKLFAGKLWRGLSLVVQNVSGRRRRIPVPPDLADRYRQQRITEDELILLMFAQFTISENERLRVHIEATA